MTLESPASTVLYTKRFTAGFRMSESFPAGTLVGPVASAMLVKVSGSSANAEANLQGYTI